MKHVIMTRKEYIENRLNCEVVESIHCPADFVEDWPDSNNVENHDCMFTMGCDECFNWPVKVRVK